MPENKAVGVRLKEMEKARNKKERFIKSRMWFSIFVSKFFPDRVKIPENIGNNVLIGNNQCVTKNSITEYVLIKELSVDTPIAMTSKIVKEVKNKVPGVRVDTKFKCFKYTPDLTAGGLKSRVNQWTNAMNNPNTSDHVKQRAAKLLYSVGVAKTREPLFKVYYYVEIKADDGAKMREAKEVVDGYLSGLNIRYNFIKSDIDTHLKFISVLSNTKTDKVKDIPHCIMSATNIAELLPAIQGTNSDEGNFFGIDKRNRSPYFVKLQGSAKAKNIYVVAPSGDGKTFLVLNWLLDAYALGYNICIMDLKGNEFSAFTKACNGITLSLRAESDQFVNTFKLHASEAVDPEVYFNMRFELSKQMMLTICDLSPAQYARGEALIEKFLQSMYSGIGVIASNKNTWVRSLELHPYTVFNKFETFLSAAMLQEYGDIAETMVNRLSIYMKKSGSKAHMFRREFVLEDVLDTKVLTFDFGMLNSSGATDPIMFKLRVMFMRILNNEFVRYKKSKGEWTMKVLEESQVAEDYLFKVYKEETTLRRSQNQVTIVLGNSVSSIADKPDAKAMLENFNMFCIGSLSSSGREYMIKEYSLEKHRNTLEALAEDASYEHCFLFVNNFEKDSTDTILQAYVPKKVTEGKIFKIVDVV